MGRDGRKKKIDNTKEKRKWEKEKEQKMDR